MNRNHTLLAMVLPFLFVLGGDVRPLRARPTGELHLRFTALDPDPATGFVANFPLGINHSGEIAGYYQTPDGALHGYLHRGGRFTTPSIGAAGAGGFGCSAINKDGVISGTYFDGAGNQHGFLLSGNRFTAVDVPGAGTGTAGELGPNLGTAGFLLNDHGELVGQYADPGQPGAILGYVRSRSGAFTSLHIPPSQPGDVVVGNTAIGINDRGVISGTYYTLYPGDPLFPIRFHGFLKRGETITYLDVPGAGGHYGTQVNGLNDRGAVVGLYSDAGDVAHGFLYQDGRYITVDYPGALLTELHAINDDGAITGSYLGADFVLHGFIAHID